MPSHPDRVRRHYAERPTLVITDEGFTANVIEGDDFYTKQAIERQLADCEPFEQGRDYGDETIVAYNSYRDRLHVWESDANAFRRKGLPAGEEEYVNGVLVRRGEPMK